MGNYEPPDGLWAFFLTFTTYGCHLHGDERGSVDRRHNEFDSPRVGPSGELEDYERGKLIDEPFVMQDEHQLGAAFAIRQLCQAHAWELYALNVRTNHVHAVVAPGNLSPERMMAALKAAATGLFYRRGLVERSRRIWSRHGSTPYLWSSTDVEGAVEYVVNGQGANLVGAVFPEWFASDPARRAAGRQAPTGRPEP